MCRAGGHGAGSPAARALRSARGIRGSARRARRHRPGPIGSRSVAPPPRSAVDHRPPSRRNPDASRSFAAPDTDAPAPHARSGPAGSLDSATRRHVAPLAASERRRRGRSTPGRGRSGGRSAPAPGSGRTGTSGQCRASALSAKSRSAVDAAGDGCNTVRRTRAALGTHVGRDDGSLAKVGPSPRLLFLRRADYPVPLDRADPGGIALATTRVELALECSLALLDLQAGGPAGRQRQRRTTTPNPSRYTGIAPCARASSRSAANIRGSWPATTPIADAPTTDSISNAAQNTYLTTRTSTTWRALMLIAVAVIVVLGLSGLRIAQEYQRGVVFRLGRYVGLRGPGCTGSFRSISSAQSLLTFAHARSRPSSRKRLRAIA